MGLEDPIEGSDKCPVVKAFAKGVELGDGTRCKPARVELLGGAGQPPSRHVRVFLREGKYHQIRRMMAALGHHVVSIHRVAIGPLVLGDLEEAEWRPLTALELTTLLHHARAGGDTDVDELFRLPH